MSERLTAARLRAFLREVDEALDRPARLYLVGEASLILAGEREWSDRPLVYTAALGDGEAIEAAMTRAAPDLPRQRESPADVVPLPRGSESRAQPAANWDGTKLSVHHFDPYSVALRMIARGDEPDYHVVLGYLRLGWMTLEEMDATLHELLTRFSSETLAQDPAEFRRKWKGLRQMWKADEARRGKGVRVWQDTPRGDTLSR